MGHVQIEFIVGDPGYLTPARIYAANALSSG